MQFVDLSHTIEHGMPLFRLKEHILIVENLTNLGALPTTNFIFHAAPVKIAGAAAFPVRAYGVVHA